MEPIVTPLDFPLGGLNLAREFDRQPQGTTRVGRNVRAYDARQRARGGSRGGLTKYLPDQVAGTDTLVQHINCFTDPTHEALPYQDEPSILPPDFDEVLWHDILYTLPDFLIQFPEFRVDPSGAWLVRQGGSGTPLPPPEANTRRLVTITPHSLPKMQGTAYSFAGTEFTATGLDTGDSITSVGLQSTGAAAGAAPGRYPIRVRRQNGMPEVYGATLGGNVQTLRRKYRFRAREGRMTVGNNPLAFVQQASYNSNLTYTSPYTLTMTQDVTAGDLLFVVWFRNANGALPSFSDTLGNTYTPITTTGSAHRMWWCLSQASGPCTLTVTYAAGNYVSTAWLEYSGALTLDTFANPAAASMSTAPITVTTDGGLVIASFGTTGFTNELWNWSAGSTGYTIRTEIQQYPTLLVMDLVGAPQQAAAVGPVSAQSSLDNSFLTGADNLAASFLAAV